MKTSKIFKGDRTLWVVFFLLSIISLVAVYSSIGLYAYSQPGTRPTGLFFKHTLIVLATYFTIIILSKINYRYFSRFAMLGYWASLFLLVVMLALHGRWFHLPVIGQFQPSEIAKVILIIFVARMIAKRQENIEDIATFFMLLVSILAVVVLVLPENFSTAALIFLSCYLMMLFGGVKRKYWWNLLAVLVLVGGVAMFVMLKTGEHSDVLERSETWVNRVDRWLNPNHDELSQENMARMAIARGGVLGAGIGNTVHARLMTQAHNDFIYAIIIEETGMVGGLVVFILYAIFYYRCVRLARRCKGTFGSLIVAGLGTVIYIQALVNMSVAVGVLPVTGQTLPFISYGGTAYLFLGCGFGVIQSVAADVERQKMQPQEATDHEQKPDTDA